MHKDFLREFEDKITGAALRRAREHLMRLTNLARPRLRLSAVRPAPRSLYREPRQLRRGTLRGARCGKSLKNALWRRRSLANVARPKSPPDTDNDMFVQILNATLDFDVFMLMMRETAKEEQRTEKEAKAAKQRGKSR
jgi:hypothetical protein